MEAVSPNTSSSSNSRHTRQTTPLCVNMLPTTTYTLPPINSFPSWNRTKLVNNRFQSKIEKDDKLKYICSINHTERFTQTSPPVSTPKLKELKAIRIPISKINLETENINKKVYENKILFLQENHKEVLSSLHREVESLKNENKALQFELVSKHNSTSNSPFETTNTSNNHYKREDSHNSKRKVSLLEQEIQSLKENLVEEKKRNSVLVNQLENGRERSISAVTTNSKQSRYFEKQKGSASHVKQKSLSARHNIETNERSNDVIHQEYQTRLQELKTLTTTQHKEMTNLRDKLDDSLSNNRRTVLPSVVTTNLKFANTDTITAHHTGIHKTYENLTLPAITTSSSQKQNMWERQKRARFNHVKRQKSNRNVFLGLSGIK